MTDERLRTMGGSAAMQDRIPRPGLHRAYNIEVAGEHCYYIGSQRLLSHNAGAGKGGLDCGKANGASPNAGVVKAPGKTPYVNHNPRATPDEVKLGELLHTQAEGGGLKGIKAVEGAAESRAKGVRSGDYRFTLDDGRVVSADKYTPASGRIENIGDSVMTKSGQAEIVVIELGSGKTAGFGAAEAKQIADHVRATPGHSIKRVIIVKDGNIPLDH